MKVIDNFLDDHQKHRGIDCTDQKIRVVINFNYFLK